MSLPHTAPTAATTAPVPAPTSSRVLKIVIGGFLLIILATIVTILWNSRARTYNLRNTKYGHVLEFKVKAGKTARVTLTYDYIPMWSSDEIERYNSQGTRTTMKGQCISGPCDSSISTHILFVNKEDHSIIVKIGRCKSKKDCNINFN